MSDNFDHEWDEEGHQCRVCLAFIVDLETDELEVCPLKCDDMEMGILWGRCTNNIPRGTIKAPTS